MNSHHRLNKLSIAVLVGLTLLQEATGFAANTIQSPDGKIVVSFNLQTAGFPTYAIQYQGKPVVTESRLGFEPDFANAFEFIGATTNHHEGQWTNAFGERRIVPDNYRELRANLKHRSGRLLRVTFRAYNEGAALRYEFPEQATNEFQFAGELTEFRFPENTFGYEEHGTEGEFQRVNTADIGAWCERPLTLEFAVGFYAALGEAANQNYPRMLLSPLADVPGALVSALGGTTSNTADERQRNDSSFQLKAGDATPWRMFIIGDKPGDLLERNYLMLNLNPPCALADISWIQPGKVMRDTTLTMTNSKAIMDFGATAGLQYVLLDSGWYGTEDFGAGDATQSRAARTTFGNPPAPLDIQELVRYGRERNVGVILYVDRRQAKKQRDILFPLYEKWGVKGVKLGFVDVGPQAETAWISETVQKAAEYHLMLNIHDGYRATGNNRTWPNLMTVEGIRGNEHMPTPEHDCTLPFTRYVGGPGDYTVCYYSRRIKTTHAHQLAMSVVSFSPLQCLFWYDKPANYHGEPEVEFFKHVPTVWDETRVLNGKIGKYATIARRSGADWFIGTINNSEPRELKVPLTFLERGKRHVAHIYSDVDSVKTRTKVGIEMRDVDSGTILTAKLKPGGGEAIWIEVLTEHSREQTRL